MERDFGMDLALKGSRNRLYLFGPLLLDHNQKVTFSLLVFPTLPKKYIFLPNKIRSLGWENQATWRFNLWLDLKSTKLDWIYLNKSYKLVIPSLKICRIYFVSFSKKLKVNESQQELDGIYQNSQLEFSLKRHTMISVFHWYLLKYHFPLSSAKIFRKQS